MNESKAVKKSQELADWLLRIDLLYRNAIHIVESIRKNRIADTDTVSQINTYYAAVKRLISLHFSEKNLPTNVGAIRKVDLAPLSEYLADVKRWENERLKINSLLMNCRELLHGLEFTKNTELESEYVHRLSTPVNILVSKYLAEKSKDGKTVVYRLSYNSLPSELMINGIVIAKPKVSATNDFYELIFSKPGSVKKAVSKDAVTLNTTSVINNLDIPPKLKTFMLTMTNANKGMVIRTIVTSNDIRDRGIDIEEVERFLSEKKG